MIDSPLIGRLFPLGHRVICDDTLQTGDLANLALVSGHSSFRFLRHDVIRPIRITGPVDVHTLSTYVEGSVKLLTLARTKRARIFLASTSELYSDPLTSPQHEADRGQVTTFSPLACHDEGKRAAETLFREFETHQGVETRIAQIFDTEGRTCTQRTGASSPTSSLRHWEASLSP